MELTKEHIKRINDFLEGIGVGYIDIRFEMVDHIATEIEENVNDIDAFFEHKGFQTPFIKYMLSQKTTYLSKYKKLKSKSFWTHIKKVLSSMFQQMIKPLNLMLILSFFFAIFYLEKFNVKYLTDIIIISFFLSFFYIAVKFNRFKKKFGEIKIIHTYVSILTLNSIIALHLPSMTPFLNETDYSPFLIYKCILMLISNYLVYMSFISQKESIEKYYTNLI